MSKMVKNGLKSAVMLRQTIAITIKVDENKEEKIGKVKWDFT